MDNYSKAIASVLGGLATIGAMYGLPEEWTSPEFVAGVGAVLTTFLVWLFPANEKH